MQRRLFNCKCDLLHVFRFCFSLSVFQKAVLDLLTDIRNEVRRVGRTELSSSVTSVKVETMESMEEFQRQEELLFDEEAFNALVR